jgi:P22_AR N-terminal domain/ORF6C domain
MQPDMDKVEGRTCMTDHADPVAPERPVEQLPVPLFDGVVLAVRDRESNIYLGLRDLCMTLSLDVSSQRRRIVANESLHLKPFRVLLDRQFRSMDFLLLDDLSLWLLGIQERRVGANVRERLSYIKRYLETAVRTAFAQVTGLPEGPSSDIEELRELDRIEQALKVLEELGHRQATLEASQDRARMAFRDLTTVVQELRTRIATLEQQARSRISPTQRNTLYRMVQHWGTARAERDSRLTTGTAIRKTWVELNTRFGITTYTDLPAARFDEAVQFIKQQFMALTGQELDAIEQAGLDLEP